MDSSSNNAFFIVHVRTLLAILLGVATLSVMPKSASVIVTFATICASEHDTFMRTLTFGAFRSAREALAAHSAKVTTSTSVRVFMTATLFLGCERSLTKVALVRSFFGVETHVSQKHVPKVINQ